MSNHNLKPGWNTWRFDQIAVSVNDRVEPRDVDVDHYVGLEHLEPDSLKIRRWGSPDDVEATKLLFKTGDIIFGRRRVYQRKLAVADFDGICSAHAMVLRPKTDVVLPEFLPFFMQSDLFMNRALEISVGSLSPTINWKTLAKQEFALPPLEEQVYIARMLWASDTLKNEYRELLQLTKMLWRSTAASFFSEDGIAFDWGNGSIKELGNLLEYGSDGPFGSKLKTAHYAESGAQVIRLQNIDEREFNNEDRAFISESYFSETLSGYQVYPGDVLIAGLGDDKIPSGRACLAPVGIGLAINKADCYCLRPKPELSSSYLVNFLNSPYGLRQSSSYAQGTTRYRLNLGNIKRMKVPIPSLAVQRRITEALDSLFEAEKLVKTRYSDQSFLLKRIINTALSME